MTKPRYRPLATAGSGSTSCLPHQRFHYRMARSPRNRPVPQRTLPLAADLVGHETVLVVHDDASTRQLLARALERFGYTATQCSDAAEAQSLARLAERIDVVLIDLSTPETAALSLALWFRSEIPSARVVVASEPLCDLHYRFDQSLQIALMARPYSPLELTHFIRRVLKDTASGPGANSLPGPAPNRSGVKTPSRGR